MKSKPPVHKGPSHHFSKFTEEDIRRIRARYESGEETQEDIALDYGVTQGTISAICRREHWKDVA